MDKTISTTLLELLLNIVCTPPSFLMGEGEGGPPTKISKKRGGDLTGPQLLEGLLGKSGFSAIFT